MTSIRNETGNITKGPTDIKWIVKEYYEKLYIHKFDYLDEMDQFFEGQTTKTNTNRNR